MTEPSETAGAGDAATTSMGIDPKLAGLLAYLLGVVSGLIIFLVEKQHQEVRYHAAQSIIVSVALIVVNIALSIVAAIPVIGWVVTLIALPLVGLGALILWIYLLVQGYQLNHVRLPWAGNLAEQWVQQG